MAGHSTQLNITLILNFTNTLPLPPFRTAQTALTGDKHGPVQILDETQGAQSDPGQAAALYAADLAASHCLPFDTCPAARTTARLALVQRTVVSFSDMERPFTPAL